LALKTDEGNVIISTKINLTICFYRSKNTSRTRKKMHEISLINVITKNFFILRIVILKLTRYKNVVLQDYYIKQHKGKLLITKIK